MEDGWQANSASRSLAAIIGGPMAADFIRRTVMTVRLRVLILCTGNSARSQMAEGLLRELGGDRFEVASAGVAPTHVRPEAIEAMKEIGIDISNYSSKSIDQFLTQPFDYVITVCDNANQHCPLFAGAGRRIHWSIEDPAAVAGDHESRLEAFRSARNELRERLEEFVEAEVGLIT
jgi:arsenate reductase